MSIVKYLFTPCNGEIRVYTMKEESTEWYHEGTINDNPYELYSEKVKKAISKLEEYIKRDPIKNDDKYELIYDVEKDQWKKDLNRSVKCDVSGSLIDTKKGEILEAIRNKKSFKLIGFIVTVLSFLFLSFAIISIIGIIFFLYARAYELHLPKRSGRRLIINTLIGPYTIINYWLSGYGFLPRLYK